MNATTINILSACKNASISNLKSIITHSNSFAALILVKLYRDGFILSFRRQYNSLNVRQFTFKIFFRNLNEKRVFHKLRFISTNSKVHTLSYCDLSRLNLKTDGLFLSTTRGIKNLIECKQLKIGGVVLFSC